jgi:LuxR family maltose regulon positive regulatory protein
MAAPAPAIARFGGMAAMNYALRDVAQVLEVPNPGSGAVLAATKLHIPGVRPELIARAALIDQLVSSPHRKLTLVEAPAGYGKTTLVAEWCSSASEERAFAWLSLDDGDSDPARFWVGVVDALRTLEPGIGAPALDALESRGIDVRDIALPLLLNELAGLERDIVLVLDDYQTVRGRDVHRLVDLLLDHLPDRLHLAIATRVDPPLSLARLRARGEMTEVRAAELRFTVSEAAELLRCTVGLDLSDDQVQRLHERTEGWPAGLYLAGLSLRGQPDRGEFIESFAGDDRHIVDYLASEVLSDQLPPAYVAPGPALRPALRRGHRHRGLVSPAGANRESKPVPGPAGYDPHLVPLSPPVRRAPSARVGVVGSPRKRAASPACERLV